MTNDELRVVLAKWAGWTYHDTGGGFECRRCGLKFSPSVWRAWELQYLWCAPDKKEGTPPNYPESLDAVATLEARLTDDEFTRYREELNRIVCEDVWSSEGVIPIERHVFSATAEQRCRALVAVLGLTI